MNAFNGIEKIALSLMATSIVLAIALVFQFGHSI